MSMPEPFETLYPLPILTSGQDLPKCEEAKQFEGWIEQHVTSLWQDKKATSIRQAIHNLFEGYWRFTYSATFQHHYRGGAQNHYCLYDVFQKNSECLIQQLRKVEPPNIRDRSSGPPPVKYVPLLFGEEGE